MSRKVPPQKPIESSAPVSTPTEKVQAHALELPKGAMIAFRKSSGANTTEFFLYPDGRISFNVPDAGKEPYTHPSRTLNDAQINQLRRQLEHSNFYHVQLAPRDAKSPNVRYTISARVGNKANAMELDEGSIPDNLRPLVDELTSLLPN